MKISPFNIKFNISFHIFLVNFFFFLIKNHHHKNISTRKKKQFKNEAKINIKFFKL